MIFYILINHERLPKGFFLSEYARMKDLADYLQKIRNNTNILHSNIEAPMMQFQKGLYINGFKNSLLIITLKVFLVI